MEIVYCCACGKKLMASDFVRGRAHNIGDQHYCVQCRPLGTAPARPAPAPVPRGPRRVPPRVPGSGSGALWGGLAVGAVLLVVLAWTLAGTGPAPPAPDPGKAVLEQVRAFAAATADPDAILARCREARARLQGTPHEAGLAPIEAAAREKKLARDADRDFGRLMELIAEVRRNDPEFKRRAELESLLGRAEALAGDKRAVVDALRAEYGRALESAAADAAREARAEAERLFRARQTNEALARLDAYPASFKGTSAAAELQRFREELSEREAPREAGGSPAEGWTVRGREGTGPVKEYLNRPNVLVTHPFDPGRPATLEKEIKVPPGHPVLRLTVASTADKDWELRVFVEGRCLFATAVGPGAAEWKSFRAPLGDYAGRSVKVRLENAANGWDVESGYWGAVELVQAADPDKLQGALRRRNEAWDGWAVTSDPGHGLPVLLGVHQGKPYVYRTHPFSREKPAALERSLAVPANVKTTFSVAVHHVPNATWEARVLVDGALLHKETVGKEPRWDRIAVDLTPYAGKTVRLRLENAADDWNSEDGFWAEPLMFTP